MTRPATDMDVLFRQAVEQQRHGRLAEALNIYDGVLRANPNFAAAHYNRGVVLHMMGKVEDALRNYDSAITLRPNDHEAHYNRAIALKALGRLEEAVRSYDQAIALKPDHVNAHNNRGNILRELRRPAQALQSLDAAIALQPDYAEAYNNKGNALKDLHQLDEALVCFEQAIALKPDYAEAYNNRGNIFRSLKRPEEALDDYDRTIALKPDYAEAYSNKGTALQNLKRSEEALEFYDRAITLKPDYAEAYSNKGTALQDLKRLDEALESYDRAIALTPDYADAYWNKSISTLLAGNHEEGWRLYEWRKNMPKPFGVWNSRKPEWTGTESLDGKILFIHAEQGLGDTIQFCRYAPLAEEKGAKVILAVQDQLVRLLKSLAPGIEIVPLADAPDTLDYHIALMSMPLALRTTVATCPARVPYLCAEPEQVAKWRARIGHKGFKIGIFWQGSKQSPIDLGRSFPVRCFEGVAHLANVRLISLQKNEGVEQLRDLPFGMRVEALGEDFDSGPDAFIDTAAVMECLDLVITSDTAIAHLAGALGRPAWVALKYVPDWRWLLDRSDSPWYPTLRLFRQPAPGDWASVFAAIEAELAELIGRPPAEARREDKARALFGEAVEHYLQGRLFEALVACDAAIRSNPNVAAQYCHRGIVLHTLQRFEEALRSFDTAIQLEPDDAYAHYSKGSTLENLGRPAEALSSYERTIKLEPDFAEAHQNRGNILMAFGRPQEALQSYDRAIARRPDRAELHNNRGEALRTLERLEEALASCDKAIELKPDYAEAYNNRANALEYLGRFSAAIQTYDHAIALKPDFAECRWNKSICTLRMGNWQEGWPLYEWRKRKSVPRGLRIYPQPEWTGKESLEGKILFIHAEQGLGDTIQFCRYALLARERGAKKVILAVQDPLKGLFKDLGLGIDIISLSAKPDAFDYHAALLSLPLAFQTTLNTCPAKVPYLRAEPERVAKWKERLGGHGFKAGICWQGNKQADIDVGRSFPVRHFEAIAKLPNVRLISLQKNDGVEQLRDLPAGMKVETLGEDFDAGPDAFVDTAAVVRCLDLVIISDTAVAHLAGALGCPTWVALKYVPDWRWLLNRSDSPWYPTLRLFRQPTRGDWPGVFAPIQSQLEKYLKGATPHAT